MKFLLLLFFFFLVPSAASATSFVDKPLNKDLSSIFQGAWQRIVNSKEIKTSQRTPQLTDLFAVQKAAGKLAYIPDRDAYQSEEYWASPRETENKKGGDCEDIAIWKYAKLRAMGWEADNLLLWSVHIKSRNIFHVILVARFEGKEWLLDSPAALKDPPIPTPQEINPDKMLDTFLFLTGFNEKGWTSASQGTL